MPTILTRNRGSAETRGGFIADLGGALGRDLPTTLLHVLRRHRNNVATDFPARRGQSSVSSFGQTTCSVPPMPIRHHDVPLRQISSEDELPNSDSSQDPK